jgi:hypothetical protein
MLTPTPAGVAWPARLAYCAAAIFTLASAGANLSYGISKGGDAASSAVWSWRLPEIGQWPEHKRVTAAGHTKSPNPLACGSHDPPVLRRRVVALPRHGGRVQTSGRT